MWFLKPPQTTKKTLPLLHKMCVKWVRTGSGPKCISSLCFFFAQVLYFTTTLWFEVFNAHLCPFLCIHNCEKRFWIRIEYSWEMACQSYSWLQNELFAIFQQLGGIDHLIPFLFPDLNGPFTQLKNFYSKMQQSQMATENTQGEK